LGLLIGTGLFSALFGVCQFYGRDFIFEPTSPVYVGRWRATGFLGQHTLFAGYVGPLVVPALAAVPVIRKGTGKLVSFAAFLGLVMGVLCTHTRAVFLGLLIGMLLLLLILLRPGREVWQREKALLVALIMGGILVILPYAAMQPTLKQKMTEVALLERSTAYSRLLYWKNAIRMTADAPFWGHGPGSFKVAYYDYHERAMATDPAFPATAGHHLVLQAHNDYLQALAELGLPGLALILVLLGEFGLRARARFRDIPADRAVLLGGVVSGLTVLLVDAAFSFPFRIAPSAMVGVVLAGLTLAPVWQSPPAGCRGD
jgi:O-antigen ligase